MSQPDRSAVEAAIARYQDPYLESDLVSAKCVKTIEVEGSRARVDVVLGFPSRGYAASAGAALREAVLAIEGIDDAEISVTHRIASHSVQKGVELLDQVKNVVAVASGKGGVGKSTVSVNLALALAHEGANVAILDADIYGPSQPRMLGVQGQPDSSDGKHLEPMVGHGVQSMSIGYLIDEDSAMIWRGPMVTQALEQLLRDTRWHEVDYLVIDLPPGTGDTQLTLAQKIPVSGAVIVTTPQDIALLDARRGLKMFEKVQVPVLGVVENMSMHVCSQCGHADPIFGEGGGERMASEHGIDLLGKLPLEARIRHDTDTGHPTMVSDPDGPVGVAFVEIARKVAAKLSQRAKDYRQAFPNIVIQNN